MRLVAQTPDDEFYVKSCGRISEIVAAIKADGVTYFMYGTYGNQERERIDPMHAYAQVDK